MKRRNFVRTTAAAAAVASITKTATAQTVEQPNILWLSCEDNNINWVGCYGNPHADTPNIDNLAKEGFQYMHAFASAPVCAPSRSTWITGINAVSMGTHPMRSKYEIPDFIRFYPEFLGKRGYYTGNSTKKDYNVGGRKEYESNVWSNDQEVKWGDLAAKQPFFQIINSLESHESKAFCKDIEDLDKTIHDPDNTKLRKYHPDLPVIRKNYARYHDAMKRMDTQIGASLAKLEELGLAENTIVIHNSDHGGVLPRSKRFLFGSGLHCPLIIRIPKKFKHLWPAQKPGMKVDRIVSFVDMTKTWLSITGSEVPSYMQGDIFLGPKTAPEKEFHFAFRGRTDERNENARAVCNKQFLYIRNYMPYAPWMQHLNYLWSMPASRAWDEHVKAGKASEVEARFFKPKEWTEEFYDMHKDPDSVDNLIDNPEYAQIIGRMRTGLRSWQEKIYDTQLIPEAEMAKLAADQGTTIYEVARNPKLYDVPALLNAADLALEKKSSNLSKLKTLIGHSTIGMRYWGIVGLFLLGDKAASAESAVRKLLTDDSHEVRIMAGWMLFNLGDKQTCYDLLESLLKERSYASLKALNVIDWLGDEGKVMLPTIQTARIDGRMKLKLLKKFGVEIPVKEKKKGGKKKKK